MNKNDKDNKIQNKELENILVPEIKQMEELLLPQSSFNEYEIVFSYHDTIEGQIVYQCNIGRPRIHSITGRGFSLIVSFKKALDNLKEIK